MCAVCGAPININWNHWLFHKTSHDCRYNEGEQSRWVALCSAPHREMLALGLLGDGLYMMGGQVRERHQQVVTASVLRWSLSAGGDWLPSSPLPLPLACHSAVSLQGELYVLGGWTQQVEHLTV